MILKYKDFIRNTISISGWEEIIQLINLEDVYENHINIKYAEMVTSKKIKNITDSKIKIDEIYTIENEKFDVVVANISNSEFVNESYIILSHIKKGLGNKYVIPEFKSTRNIEFIKFEGVIVDQNYYNSSDVPIIESKGVPNQIKNIGEKITNNILENIKNGRKIDNYNLLGENITIEINNSKIDDIRGKSTNNIMYLTFDFNNINYLKLSRVVYHELIHIYEIIKRVSKDSKHRLQWNINNILRSLTLKYKSQFVSDICYLIYQSFDHEINARVSDVYPFLMSINIPNKDILKRYLENTESWKYKEMLKNWKPNWEMVDWMELIEFLNEFNLEVISKNEDLNFKIYKLPKNEKECKDIIKGWVWIFRKKSKHFEEKLIRVIDEVIKDIEIRNSSVLEKNNDRWFMKTNLETLRNLNINEILESKNNIVDEIKNYLISRYDSKNWKSFVDSQELGDCQSIVHAICSEFNVKKVFGEIEIDEPYIDEYGDEQYKMTHHWVEIEGEIYDFSKGTLKDYIEWFDLYEPDVFETEIYNPIN